MEDKYKVLREKWEKAKAEEESLRKLYDSAMARTHEIFREIIALHEEKR